ncbi:hypothetical protein HII28_00400 [Planctomonas sp. JC2975]|uniref:hypothetical protein n=1 Tax=Planctomonas sp. JC2975 TaxID=2729626 RepID=UPI001472E4A5|nr:hypothetical protein [Planctomonas sp. JC2975]NNC10345.1 hypothetical protein [Planctomonas sp. JC2975]
MSESILFDSGDLVLASENDRTVTGRLLPFGVVGKTNIGGFTVEAGAIGLPSDPSILGLNVEHDREQPVGRALSVEERADGVYATFQLARTAEGDQALADIRSGTRKSLSMEAKGVIVRAGKAIAGRIFGAGLVATPAFEGATVIASFNDVPEALIDPDNDNDLDATVIVTTTETTTVIPAEDEDADASESEDEMAEATIPETVTASAAPVKSETTKRLEALEASVFASGDQKKGISPEQAFSVMASIARGGRVSDDLHNQVFRTPESLFDEAKAVYATQTNIASPIQNQDLAPQWTGEYWGRVVPKPLLTDLLTPKTLVSRNVTGFKWSALPTLGSWAGNGAEIASSGVTAVQPTMIPAQYAAGGNTVSRENFDFGGGEAFLSEYFGFQAKNVQVWLDSLAFTNVVEGSIDGGATVIAGPHLSAAAAVPSNIDAGTSALVDSLTSYYAARLELPDFVLLDYALWTAMLKSPATQVLGYLKAALGVSEGEIENITVRPIPTAKLAQAKQATGTNGSGTNRAIKALAGAKAAAEVYTLPGSPFQAQVINVANGLINVGVYAYGLTKPASDTISAHLSDGFYGVY